MSDVLKEICDRKREHVISKKAEKSLADIESLANQASSPRGFYNQLNAAKDKGRYGLICEIKKASPSKGLIRPDFNPPIIAKAYEDGGATCLSVLTDTPYFQGEDQYLVQARANVPLPCLRKDFMIDTYQVPESRALGADCILLIMAALDDAQAAEMESAAIDWDMDVLIEVHNAEELERALKLKSPLIGINNRNLKTMEVSLNTTLSLAKTIEDENRMVVGESGLRDRSDLNACAAVGVNSFLIGETFMRQDDVSAAVKAML